MFKCPIINCDKRFKHKGELVRHSQEHDNILWTCRVCQYETNMEQKLTQLMSVHTQKKWFKCKYREEKFVHTMQLVRHYPKCTKNPNYVDQ